MLYSTAKYIVRYVCTYVCRSKTIIHLYLFKFHGPCCVLLHFMLLLVGYGQGPQAHHSVGVVSDPRITGGCAVTQQKSWKQARNGVLKAMEYGRR